MLPLRDDNPSLRAPLVTLGLIVLNVLAFLYQLTYLPDFSLSIHRFGLVPVELTQGVQVGPVAPAVPPWATLLTSMFLHGGFLHIAANMVYLWVFGDNIEDAFGHLPFLAFYLGGGLVAAATHIAFSWSSPVPMVGASGAIAAVLGAYLVLHPTAKVEMLVFLIFVVTIVEVPAGVLLVLWIGLQLLSLGAPGVAWMAHIGGFAAGAAVALAYRAAGGRPPTRHARRLPPRLRR